MERTGNGERTCSSAKKESSPSAPTRLSTRHGSSRGARTGGRCIRLMSTYVDIVDIVDFVDFVDIVDIVDIVKMVDIVDIVDTVDIFSNLEQC